MLGFLGTNAPVIVDFTLIFQIVIFAMLLFGYKTVREKKLRRHGITMATAVLLHIISIFTVMIPSVAQYPHLLLILSNPLVIITWFHIFTGSSVAVLGMFLVLEWRFRRPPNMKCARRRRLMRPLLLLWLITLVLGIIFYIVGYLF